MIRSTLLIEIIDLYTRFTTNYCCTSEAHSLFPVNKLKMTYPQPSVCGDAVSQLNRVKSDE